MPKSDSRFFKPPLRKAVNNIQRYFLYDDQINFYASYKNFEYSILRFELNIEQLNGI